MSTKTYSQFSLGRLGALLFARQTGFEDAPRHAGVLGAVSAWASRRAATAELSGLSDRDLADIGLTRQEIPAVVRRRRTM